MSTKEKEINLPDIGIESADIKHSMKDQSAFHIGWIYDCLIRHYQTNTDTKKLTTAQRDHLKEKAVNDYIELHESLIPILEELKS